MPQLTLKDNNKKIQGALLKSIFDALGEAATEREADATEKLPKRNTATADVSSANGDTMIAWELGKVMWDDGTDHLPTEWCTETCPKLLNLRTVPRLNVFKALVRQIQGGVVSSMPAVEFDVEDFMKSQMLDERWLDATQGAHFMAQLDLAVQWNSSFGLTFFGIGKGGRIDLNHPEIVVYEMQDNWQDVNWCAKFFIEKRKEGAGGTMPIDNKLKWPESLINSKDAQKVEIRAEVWVKRGGKMGDMTFKESGMRFVVRSDNEVLEEEDWPFDFLPLYPVALSPRGKIRGAALSAECWYTAVRIDMTLGKKLAILNQAGADKWIVGIGESANPGIQDEGIRVGKADVVNQLKSPGQEVVVTSQQVKKEPSIGSLEEVNNELREARADLEYTMGISQAYQGIKPPAADSGKAIQVLAQESSKRVARMALFLSESIRGFAEVWGRWTIYQESGEIVDNLKCKVALVPQEEITRGRQQLTVERILEVAEKSTMPGAAKILIDVAPGLSEDTREKLREAVDAKEMQAEQDMQNAISPAPGMGQEGMPETELPPEMADVGLPSEPAIPSGSEAGPNIYQ